MCGVVFEGLPVCLWTIRLGQWSEIDITDTDKVKLRQYHVSTWEFVNSKLVIVDGEAITRNPAVEVWLVSGPLEYIVTVEGRLGSSMVGWISDATRRRPKIDNPRWMWTNVSHIRVGG